MENFQKRLATMIRSAREAQSLTQDKLGELISVDQSMVGHYERGKAKPRLSTLCLLIRVLNLDVNELFYGESYKNNEQLDEITRLVKQLDSDSKQKVIDYINFLQWKHNQNK
jgi:transcriptional regulator with XRE-family HTH domain